MMKFAVAMVVVGFSWSNANLCQAQSVADQVARVRDGVVRMSFAARAGVCGNGDNVSIASRSWQTEDWESQCEAGPVRLVVTKEAGRIAQVRVHVGGRWKTQADRTDLGSVPSQEATRWLMEVAHTADEDPAKKAVYAAALADSVTIWPELSELAREVGRPLEVRESAVFWIGQLGGDDGVTFLEDLLQANVELALQEKAIFALSQSDSERGEGVLKQLAEDADAELAMREKAIFWLGQGRSNDTAEYLRTLYGRLRSEPLKEKVIFALSQRRNASNADWLIDRVAMNEQEPMELREKAIFWFGQMRGESAALAELYDRISPLDLRERVIFALSQRRHDDAALAKLMDIARNERSPDLRKKAIFWLGQSRDQRAAEFLAELIGR